MPFLGLQVTHKGNKLCCNAKTIIDGPIKNFWQSEHIKNVRQKMLKGELVDDCEICYGYEARNQFSLRQHYNNLFKNHEPSDQPKYLDLDWSNLCNLQCIMCGPVRSSQWTKELGMKNITPISQDRIDELLSMSESLRHLSIQGGEPSLMPEFEYLLNALVDLGLSKNITIDCISNLTNTKVKFYSLLQHFKSVDINVSVDAYGRHNDYIRYPSKFYSIEQNLLKLINTNVQVNLQITVQTLSMFDFYRFLVWVAEMQDTFSKHKKKLGLNLSYVHKPSLLDITKAPNPLKESFITQIQRFRKAKKSISDTKFSLSLKMLEKTLIDTHRTEDTENTRAYIEQLDQRRSIKITNYIPNFYDFFSEKPIK